MNYKMDFVKDFQKIAKNWLEIHGFQRQSNDDYIGDFLRWFRLYIPSVPRQVHFSKELQNSCKFKQYRKEIDLIKQTFESGKDIAPFTSTRKAKGRKNPYNDSLFNNWHIRHLHLNVEKNEKGYIERSKDLLFCIIQPENVYMIDIRAHSDNWADIKLLEIVDNNWSKLLEPFMCDLDIEYNQTQYEQCRKHNATSMVCVNEKTFIPFEFCVAMDGTSYIINYARAYVTNYLKQMQKFFGTDEFIINNVDKNSVIELVDFSLTEINDKCVRFLSLTFMVDKKHKIHIEPNICGDECKITIAKWAKNTS